MSEEEKIGKNLFEYNGIIYTDNIPKNMFISITKEQYAEYMQQKEMIQQQQKEIEELKSQNNEIVKELKPRVRIDDTEYIERNFISKDKIKEKLNQIYEEYQEILSSNRNLQEKNIATFQHGAMRTVLEELLEE